MEAAPSSSFKMAEPDLLLELLVVTLDTPAQFGQIDETGEADVVRQSRQPILGRLLLAFGPFDEKPFFRPRLTAIEVAPGDTNTQARPRHWLVTATPRLGSCPACRAGHNTAAPHQPN